MSVLFKADKIDGSGETKGRYRDSYHYIISKQEKDAFGEYTYSLDLIDPSTLKISFDNGESWRSVEEVKDLLKPVCKICNGSGVNHGAQFGYGKYKSIPCSCVEEVKNILGGVE